MFKIQLLNNISNLGLQEFPSAMYELGPEVNDPHVLLVRSKSLHDMVINKNVLAIGRAGTGIDNIPIVEVTKRGIPIFNTPGANANAVRELVIAGMLLVSRNLCHAWHYVNQTDCHESDLKKVIEQNKKQFVGFELMGKTLGVIGLGSVGVKVGNAALSLGMKVIGYDPSISVQHAWELSSTVQKANQLADLLKVADFISLHVPLTDKTKHLINAETLGLIKNSAVVLNFSRDGIIEKEALLNALNANHLHAYVTDFPSSALRNHPKVICLPHLGASTQEAEENCAVMIAKQLRAYLEHGSIINAINFPTVEVSPITQGTRVAITNLNIPNMVAQISAKLAEHSLNILSLVNQSKNEIAYTLIDVDKPINENILTKLSMIEGVLHVRQI